MSTFWSAWVMLLATFEPGHRAVSVRLGAAHRCPDAARRNDRPRLGARSAARRRAQAPTWWVVFSAGLFVWGLLFLVLFPGFGGFQGCSAGHPPESSSAKPRPTPCGSNRPSRGSGACRLRHSRDAGVTSIGAVLYEENCAACHGRDGRGNQVLGSPNLVDGNSLYGNDTGALLTSILDGRRGAMPALGGVLGHEGANEAAAYVLSLNGYQAPADWIAAGKGPVRSTVRRLSRRRWPGQPGARRPGSDRRCLALRSRLQSHDANDPRRPQRLYAGVARAAGRGSRPRDRGLGVCGGAT